MQRDIPGYEGYYKACVSGKIYSIISGKFLTPGISRTGYCSVVLCINQIKKQFLVHRLIATTFLPNPYNKEDVNHIDFNRVNNQLENLEWATRSENIRHSFRHGRKKSNLPIPVKGFGHYNNRPIIKYNKINNQILKEYNSLTEAVQEGFKYSSISMCLTGKHKTSAGFIWKYKN